MSEYPLAFVSVKLSRTGRTQEYRIEDSSPPPQPGDAVVVQTETGPALGHVVPTIPALADRRRPSADSPQVVLRRAAQDDVVRRLKHQHREQEAMRIALMKIRERVLPMKLARVEQLCGRLKCCLRYELPNGKG